MGPKFEELKDFLQEKLIINWDQTGLNLVPASTWTMGLKGSKRAEIKGIDDNRQGTAVFAVSLHGDFLPVQTFCFSKRLDYLPFTKPLVK